MTTTEKPPVMDYEASKLPPLWPMATVMATGVFATTFVQLQCLGYLPFQHLLMQSLGMDTIAAGAFLSFATLPWTLKPIAGLLIDGYPLFGTRRRWYLMLGALVASLLWLLLAFMPPAYYPLMIVMFAMNIAIVFGSVASGGLLVEAGQRYGASGRLSSLRVAAQNLGAALGSLVGGFLATKALGFTGVVAILPLAILFTASFLLLREPVRFVRSADFWPSIVVQFKRIFRSPTLWAAAVLLFFIQAVPNFRNTVQYEYQTKTMRFSDAFLGVVNFVAYGAAIAGPLFYSLVCRKLSLRFSLYIGCILVAVSALPYLGYRPGLPKVAAIVIEAVGMFAMYLGFMPLFDLAVRATPKGSEALGYSLLISVWNWGLFCSNIVGPVFYEKVFHKQWSGLVWLNAGMTLLGIVIIFILPRALVDSREGDGSQ